MFNGYSVENLLISPLHSGNIRPSGCFKSYVTSVLKCVFVLSFYKWELTKRALSDVSHAKTLRSVDTNGSAPYLTTCSTWCGQAISGITSVRRSVVEQPTRLKMCRKTMPLYSCRQQALPLIFQSVGRGTCLKLGRQCSNRHEIQGAPAFVLWGIIIIVINFIYRALFLTKTWSIYLKLGFRKQESSNNKPKTSIKRYKVFNIIWWL